MRGGLAGWGEGAQTLNQAQRAAGRLTLRVLNYPEALCLLQFWFRKSYQQQKSPKTWQKGCALLGAARVLSAIQGEGGSAGKGLGLQQGGGSRQQAACSLVC